MIRLGRFITSRLRVRPLSLPPRRFQNPKETSMKWETPKACDFRFGFEITMYIATR